MGSETFRNQDLNCTPSRPPPPTESSNFALMARPSEARFVPLKISRRLQICVLRGLTGIRLFVHGFQVELEFGNVDFCGGRKTGEPGEKPSEQRREPTTKLSPHMTPRPGIEPGPHWWEMSTLTTAPSLACYMYVQSPCKQHDILFTNDVIDVQCTCTSMYIYIVHSTSTYIYVLNN